MLCFLSLDFWKQRRNGKELWPNNSKLEVAHCPVICTVTVSLLAIHFLTSNLFLLSHTDPGCPQPWPEKLLFTVGNSQQRAVSHVRVPRVRDSERSSKPDTCMSPLQAGLWEGTSQRRRKVGTNDVKHGLPGLGEATTVITSQWLWLPTQDP